MAASFERVRAGGHAGQSSMVRLQLMPARVMTVVEVGVQVC